MVSSHMRRSLRLVESTTFTKVPSRLTSRSTSQHILSLTRSITTTSSYKAITTNNSNNPATRTAPKPPIVSTPTLPAKPSTASTSTSNTSTAPAPTTDDRAARILAPTPTHQTTSNISKTGLADAPLSPDSPPEEKIDWTRSFHGLSAAPFPKEVADILLAEVDPEEVEIKPDGILYLPEIKYRRILNRAFGPGGWGLVPRSESIVTPRTVTREYALVCNGRLVSVARGEQDYFTPDGIPTATEGCRSNALVRCCKDLGIASELWDPRWIRKFKAQYTREVFVEHVVNKKRTKIWVRKDDQVSYPWKETGTK
ncbi:hypothetical protein LV164_002980 [Aspergillus fumigatus]|uniref:Mitochondrial genome maintenance protein MGM101 n=2 Tax=Aspergillus fumigatus TaxID=746128 RepID=B0XS00_ASPFC|nr:mitochondrial genome maintenance protein Mgm101, putative [Aspergillus fumigatus A1163]KAF4263134.1 hypothetical protein CNMCM8812_004261 [Aspergillus fumigatus]KMK62024.1 putative genome maintenance protein Mgm101 [Aspergillus fumigatus Z5]KAF4285633.1 hypothetical protein CNMCM8689_004299 [Aspergillus fumigatus]KAF4289717.1 hypothetical protein CNMCM8686_002147 [Aspergillus fumigatus]